MITETQSISRSDLLAVLASMGVDLPETTKLGEDVLQKRLASALDAAQDFDATFGSKATVDPGNYPAWTDNRMIMQVIKRGNLNEAMQNAMGFGPNPMVVQTHKSHTFREMRQSVMAFYRAWDQGLREMCMMDNTPDENRTWGVYIRVSTILKVEENVPLVVFLYKEIRSSSSQSFVDVLRDHVQTIRLESVLTTELERMALLKLFRINAKRMPSDYSLPQSAQKLGMKASFVVPLGPLGMRDIAKLTKNSGCDVCGKAKVSRCTQCLSASYCGTECQSADWPNHKQTCRSLKGGTWHTINCDKGPAHTDANYRLIINKNDPLRSSEQMMERAEDLTTDSIPPNIHDGRPFIVKIQIAFFPIGEKAHMIIYDRQRSFQLFWNRKDNPDLFDDAEELMGDKLKIYRYAKRIGDRQFSICFDRHVQNPGW